MEQNPREEHPEVVAQNFTTVVVGGLALHGSLSAAAVMNQADVMGLCTEAAAQTVHDLIGEGLVSVQREGTEGHLAATPAMEDLPRHRRAQCIMAYLSGSKRHPLPDAKGQANA